MKYRLLSFCFSLLVLLSFSSIAQQSGWPKTFNTNGSIVKLYEPEPESYQDNILKIRSAVSLLREGKTDPVFGVLWADVNTSSRGNSLTWETAAVTNLKFPGDVSDEDLNQLTSDLEKQVSGWNITISKADLTTRLENREKVARLSETLNNTPPRIIYTQKPSILVLIDGQPQLSQNPTWDVEQVTNTPFTIIKNTDQQYYLYGNKSWFRAASINGPWSMASQLPSRLNKVDQDVRASDTTKSSEINNAVAQIIVSTEPAELIQSNGEANFLPIEGTNLLYMSNSSNDVFLDVNSQQYFALISGRWYKASNLNSGWTYTPSDKIPADFAKIPEGSPKDVVLPNVAGTNAANESVMEAQVPQTARVDRKNAQASITYDGEPQFEKIAGTRLRYAVNTPGTVLNVDNRYYSVENGVWFESYSASGPWTVATSRPDEVENIPPSYPVYNVKYVYIYDATPDYVYMGYTPGYLGNYIYGPTIVYGTGYYYKPWRGRYYYPRAYTWGFNMRYNPWTGWNFGINYWGGWFSFGVNNYYRGSNWGGWWGPRVYRPSYFRPYNYNRGYYGGNVIVNNYTIINNNRNNNLYRNQRNVVTRDRQGYYNGRSNQYGNYNSGGNNNGRYNNGRYNNSSNNNGRYNNGSNNNGGYNSGRYNNGRVMQGSNNGSGNRVSDQRPGSELRDRQVSRPYQPGNQNGGFNNNQSGLPGNNNRSGRIAGPEVQPGNGQQPGSNPRIYTPGNNNNGRFNQEVPGTDRSPNPVISNSRPPVNRRDIMNGAGNENPSSGNEFERPRVQQDRPVRIAQDRNMNAENRGGNQFERPNTRIENRPSNEPSFNPSQRIERSSNQPSYSPSPRMERQPSQPSYSPSPRMERQSGPPSGSQEPRIERPSRNINPGNSDGGGRSEGQPRSRGLSRP